MKVRLYDLVNMVFMYENVHGLNDVVFVKMFVYQNQMIYDFYTVWVVGVVVLPGIGLICQFA